MAVLLVHGMGRTPRSMARLARMLQQEGHWVENFGYHAARESFDAIARRLTIELTQLAASSYAVVGHSLGGLLLRQAIAGLPADARRPLRLIMLGTPNHSPRLARRFERAWWYQRLNGDAGELLASPGRMEAIPPCTIPTTLIIGTRGLYGRWTPFGNEPNDGLVAKSEAQLDGIDECITVKAMHPAIMNHPRVREVVRGRCACVGVKLAQTV
jgi:hypothetical protein